MESPAFSFYAQDFLTGVTFLTNEEIGIYIKMLCKQWTDGKIPKKRLGFLVGFEWEKLSEELKEKFTDCGDYLINERLEKEREKKVRFKEKQAENGKKGGRPLKIKNPDETQKKPLENENEIEKEIDIENKGKESLKGKPNPNIPDWDTFLSYGKEKEPAVCEKALKLKYDAWIENNWRDGNNSKITNWKTKLLHTLPFIAKIFNNGTKAKQNATGFTSNRPGS